MGRDGVKRVGVIAKPHAQGLTTLLHKLLPWCDQRQVEVFLDTETAASISHPNGYLRTAIPGLVDFIMVLGGDGTLLSVTRLLGQHNIPILGVNMGSLGFLTETTTSEVFDQLEKVLDGDFVLQDRIRLTTCIHRQEDHLPQPFVLNDVVINKGALARILSLVLRVSTTLLPRQSPIVV